MRLTDPPPDMRGRICLITGATSGIGRVAAGVLSRGGARLFIVGRDPARSAATLAELKSAGGAGSVEVLHGDLSSQCSIRTVARNVRLRTDRLHVLINNAG